jgi:uncharacterized protein
MNNYFRTHQFILTGSSARKLRRGGVNLLAGRALLTHFHPFMAAELGTDFSIDAALRNGLIPLIVSANAPGKTLATYKEIEITQDVPERLPGSQCHVVIWRDRETHG